MLYCLACRHVVAPGENACSFCANGFISQLGCGTCGKAVERGFSTCPHCGQTQPATPSQPVSVKLTDLPALPVTSLATLPQLPLASSSPARSGSELQPIVRHNFGVTSEVVLNAGDVDVMAEMSDMILRLHQLAGRMNDFAGYMESTRRCIKGCRQLATDLQEEIETRRGPTR